MTKIPVTIVSGHLGSGKTTLIINLIKQLPPNSNVVWLKNEYGDKSIDSVLAAENNIKVAEMLNGCLCCVLVGKLGDALNDIVTKFQPSRIIIESSGTAYPLPIAWEVDRIPGLRLDGVISVIDALNFAGYKDTGPLSRKQNECVDLVVINKVGLVDSERLEQVKDSVFAMHPVTPKLESVDAVIPPSLIFGLSPAELQLELEAQPLHKHEDDVEVFSWEGEAEYTKEEFESLLANMRGQGFVRIKGVIKTSKGYMLLNWVFGRLDWQELSHYQGRSQVVFMARHGQNLQQQTLAKMEALKK